MKDISQRRGQSIDKGAALYHNKFEDCEYQIQTELESEYDVFMTKRVSKALVQDENFFANLQDAANKYELFMIYNGGSSVEFSGK